MDWANIHRKMSYGAGKEAKVLGPPWDVFRVGAGAVGNFFDIEQKIASNINASYDVMSAAVRHSLEGEKAPSIIYYEIKCDMIGQGVKVGDVFLSADQTFQIGCNKVTFETTDVNAFCFCQGSPGKPFLAVRINKLARVFRQSSNSSAENDNDAWAPGLDNVLPVILASGRFYLAPTIGMEGTVIPVGLFPVPRPYGDKSLTSTPGAVRKSGWACYVPPLPGFHLKEGDRLQTVDGANYYVIFPSYQETGAVGTYMFLERETPQTVD